jgi:hypothetical protein
MLAKPKELLLLLLLSHHQSCLRWITGNKLVLKIMLISLIFSSLDFQMLKTSILESMRFVSKIHISNTHSSLISRVCWHVRSTLASNFSSDSGPVNFVFIKFIKCSQWTVFSSNDWRIWVLAWAANYVRENFGVSWWCCVVWPKA